ncbi:MAG: formylglycine-generating enzyme family protein [Cytophagaceae bacterium]|nr:formylglycine-generating enzyme family protein [Cytophagaceae bacterium]
MKQALIPLIFCFGFLPGFAQEKFTLPGIKLNESIYADHREVSKSDWLEFVSFVSKDESFPVNYFKKMLPYGWSQARLPKQGTQNQPVTGISWEQANAYCRWRSVVATFLLKHNKLSTFMDMTLTNQVSKSKIQYRLPTDKEWVALAKKTKASEALPTSKTGFRCVAVVENFL